MENAKTFRLPKDVNYEAIGKYFYIHNHCETLHVIDNAITPVKPLLTDFKEIDNLLIKYLKYRSYPKKDIKANKKNNLEASKIRYEFLLVIIFLYDPSALIEHLDTNMRDGLAQYLSTLLKWNRTLISQFRKRMRTRVSTNPNVLQKAKEFINQEFPEYKIDCIIALMRKIPTA